jgi:hypothetical protein
MVLIKRKCSLLSKYHKGKYWNVENIISFMTTLQNGSYKKENVLYFQNIIKGNIGMLRTLFPL